MTSFFLFYLLPGFLSAVVIIIATYSIEKLGPIVGGLISSMPHLVVINAIFIILTSPNDTKIKESLYTIPAGIISDALFLLSWKCMPHLIKINHPIAQVICLLLCSYVFWSVAPTFLILILGTVKDDDTREKTIVIIGISCAILSITMGIISTFMELIYYKPAVKVDDVEMEQTVQSAESKKTNVQNWKTYFFRGLAAFIASTMCNLLASLGYSVLSGFVSVFPAMFSVAMVSLWISHGSDLPIESAGKLMLGVNSLNVFAISLALLYLDAQIGMIYAISIAFSASILFGTVPIFFFLRWIERHKEKKAKVIMSLELDNVDSNEDTVVSNRAVNTDSVV